MTTAINNTASDITLNNGRVIPASGSLDISYHNFLAFSYDEVFLTGIVLGNIIVNDGQKNLSLVDAIDHIKGFQQKSPTTSDGRFMGAPNGVPAGFSLYVTGESDDIANGTHGGGDSLLLENGSLTKEFQMLDHYYVLSGEINYEYCDLGVKISGILYAPATTGLINQAGDFDKVSLGGGANMIVPADEGQGAWDLDLSAVHTGTSVLKAVPVPELGNNGWFDYDSENNIITENFNQEGGYNLYDFDVNLHAFGRNSFSASGASGKTEVKVENLVGKLIYNSWKLKFSANALSSTGGLFGSSPQRVGINMRIGAKGNI